MLTNLLTSREATPPCTPLTSAQTLRVAVISDAASGRNGVGTYYDDLVAQLRPCVDDISLLAPLASAKADHQWFSIPLPGDATQRLAYPKTRALAEFLDSRSPHVVILPTVGPYAVLGLRLARRRRVSVCMTHHTNFARLPDLYWPRLLAGPCRHLLNRVTRWMIRRSDCVIGMNVESMEEARRNGARRARIVGTPLSSSFLDTPRQPLHPGLTRVLFLGRLAAEKGIGRVLEAAARLPDYHFAIGGDGPLRRVVESAAARLPNLDYLGWLRRGQVLQALDASDMLVLPSSLETFGTVALEALARHRLVLVTRDCGIAQWSSLAEGLFAIERDESLADAVVRVGHMPGERRQAIARAGWQAAEEFQRETLEGWLHVLAEVAQTAPVGGHR